jgi:hypothetical protein
MNQSSSTHGGRRPGAGRKAGVPNKLSTDVKQMVLKALNELGGYLWLVNKADEVPEAFMRLVARLIPTEVGLTGPGGQPLQIQVVHFVRPELPGAAPIAAIEGETVQEMPGNVCQPEHELAKSNVINKTNV